MSFEVGSETLVVVELVEFGCQVMLPSSDSDVEWKVTLKRVFAVQEVQCWERLRIKQEV